MLLRKDVVCGLGRDDGRDQVGMVVGIKSIAPLQSTVNKRFTIAMVGMTVFFEIVYKNQKRGARVQLIQTRDSCSQIREQLSQWWLSCINRGLFKVSFRIRSVARLFCRNPLGHRDASRFAILRPHHLTLRFPKSEFRPFHQESNKHNWVIEE